MERLGVWLRQTREAKGSTLEEAEAATCIRARFLESLEAEDFAALPGGDVQVRGFLRIYARYLAIPPEEALNRYNANEHGTEAPASENAPAETKSESLSYLDEDLASIQFRPRDISVSSSLPRWMSFETVLITGLVLAMLLAVIGVAAYLTTQQSDERPVAQMMGTAASEVGLSPTMTPIPGLTPAFPVSADGGVTVTLEALEHVWVRVTRDGRTAFEDTMASGQTETWSGQERITVRTDDGAGLQVTVNGQRQGAMCGQGEACDRTWGPMGETSSPR